MYTLHRDHMIHRDIKPQNILVSNDKVLFADFGVSKQVQDYTATMVGTPLYFSPEQFEQKPYSTKADIFALGLVFINILTGSHPFSGN